jgi:hypothetical protein
MTRHIAPYFQGKVVEKELYSTFCGREVYRYIVSNEEDIEKSIEEFLKRFPDDEKKRLKEHLRKVYKPQIEAVLDTRRDIEVGERVFIYVTEDTESHSAIKLLYKEQELLLFYV